MPLYTFGGKLLVVDGALAAHEDCCCPFDCAEFLACYGSVMDATVNLSGWVNGSCTDCSNINGPIILSDMPQTSSLPNTCYYNKATPTGTGIFICEGIRELAVQVFVGKLSGSWSIEVEVNGPSTGAIYALFGTDALNAIKTGCPGGTLAGPFNLPLQSEIGPFCEGAGSSCTISFGAG